MPSNYVTPRAAGHSIEMVDGVEQVRLPNRRNWFVILLLPVWLCGWTWGGVSTIRQLFEHFDLFMVFWLGMWAAGWIFAASTLAAQIGGSEIARVIGGDLEVSNGVGPLRRVWRYQGSSIRNLMAWTTESMFDRQWSGRGIDRPFFLRPRSGAVRFDDGADTLFFAGSADEPEGRIIVEWLARRLPASATRIGQ